MHQLNLIMQRIFRFQALGIARPAAQARWHDQGTALPYPRARDRLVYPVDDLFAAEQKGQRLALRVGAEKHPTVAQPGRFVDGHALPRGCGGSFAFLVT